MPAKREHSEFTDLVVKKLKPEAKEYWRRESGGLALRVLPSGSKLWYFIYTSPEDGKKKYSKLGEYPDMNLSTARDKCGVLRVDVRSHKVDPKEQEKRQREAAEAARLKAEQENYTVADLIDEYIEKHAKPHKRGWAEDKRILEHDALKVWGNRKAVEITKRDVVRLLEGIIERGSPGSANNNFKIIRKMFRFAVQRDILTHSPCEGVVMPAPQVHKDRVLSAVEVKTFWQTLDTCRISDEIKRVLRLILLTGQRPGEVVGMHTEEIDGHWWTIPAARSKNKKAHRVYLTATALDLIGPLEAPDATTGGLKPVGYIFPSPRPSKGADGQPIIKPIAVTAIAHAVRFNIEGRVMKAGQYVCDEDGNPISEGNRLGVDEFTPHDLRRTAATFMSELGFHDEVIDAVLNHVKQGIIRTYNQNRYDREKQQALEAWERKLTSIISGSECKVVPLRKKA